MKSKKYQESQEYQGGTNFNNITHYEFLTQHLDFPDYEDDDEDTQMSNTSFQTSYSEWKEGFDSVSQDDDNNSSNITVGKLKKALGDLGLGFDSDPNVIIGIKRIVAKMSIFYGNSNTCTDFFLKYLNSDTCSDSEARCIFNILKTIALMYKYMSRKVSNESGELQDNEWLGKNAFQNYFNDKYHEGVDPYLFRIFEEFLQDRTLVNTRIGFCFLSLLLTTKIVINTCMKVYRKIKVLLKMLIIIVGFKMNFIDMKLC